jgi:chromosome segregation ATPase
MKEGDWEEKCAELLIAQRKLQDAKKECNALKSKIGRLEVIHKELKARERETERRCNEQVGELELQLAGAVDTIEALRSHIRLQQEDMKQEKIRYMNLLKEFNEQAARIQYFERVIVKVGVNYEAVNELALDSEVEKQRLQKEVKDLRVLNKLFMEEIKSLNKQLN